MTPFIDEGLDGPELSEAQKKKFHEALKGKLDIVTCRECPQSRGFVQVIDFLIPYILEGYQRIDRASAQMEKFIEIYEQLEEKAMKERFEPGGSGR